MSTRRPPLQRSKGPERGREPPLATPLPGAARAVGLLALAGAAMLGCTLDIPDVTPCLRDSDVPRDGLVARWTFDQRDSGILDLTGKQTTTIVGAPKPISGPTVCGTALQLSGERIEVGSSDLFQITGNMTIAARVSPAAAGAANQAILSKSLDTLHRGFQLAASVESGLVNFHLRIAIPDQSATTTPPATCANLERISKQHPADGRFYLVTGVFDGPGKKLDVYVDGELDDGAPGDGGLFVHKPDCSKDEVAAATADIPLQQVNDPDNEVAIASDPGTSSKNPFAGTIDDLLVWTRALSADEVRALGPSR
jgi:hypothetical protein